MTPPKLAAELTPHVVIFFTQANFDHKKLEVNAHKGLLYVETLGGGAGNSGRLLTVWRDKPAYDAAKPQFLNETGLLNDKTLFEGYHLGTREGEKSFVKRLTLAQICATIAILVVALQNVKIIGDASGWLFGPPAIETSIHSTPTDVLIGEPFKFEMTARNTSPLGESYIEFLKQLANPPNGLSLDQLAVRSVPAIKPDGKAVLPVSGKALSEGKYTVLVEGRAKAGYISSKLKFTMSAEVRVWPRLALSARRVKNRTAEGKVCQAEFDLRVGRRFPAGIDAVFKLERVPGVLFIGLSFPGKNVYTPYQKWDKPGKEVATLEWRSPELIPMTAVPFTIILESTAKQGKTSEEWEAVVQGIQFTYDEAR